MPQSSLMAAVMPLTHASRDKRADLKTRHQTIQSTAFIRNEHGIVPLRPQGANREHVNVMGGVVAAEGRRRSDNGAKLGLGVACRWVGGDLLAQALDIPDAVGYLGLAELDFQRRPAAVAKLDDDELAEIRATRIGFVFQSFNLLPRMTVLDNVMLPLAYTDVPHGDRERRAVSALRAAGLPVDHYDHRTNELSGGQMQRVAIARALVNDPAIILADEPTGNLDSATGRMVLDTFHALRQQGKTIVLITHDADIAAEADRRITIRDGRLYRDARSAPVVCRPSEAIGCPPTVEGCSPVKTREGGAR